VPGPLDAPCVADEVGLSWDVPVDDTVEAVATARASYGDSFVVRRGGNDYLFTFSPTGVESFYALPEDAASKGLADYMMLRKLPDEVFVGRRLLPSALFWRDDVTSWAGPAAPTETPSTPVRASSRWHRAGRSRRCFSCSTPRRHRALRRTVARRLLSALKP
jgi:hypothetical protein